MRGARARGLTPAGAGSTVSDSDDQVSSRAYPRRCGEHRRRHHLSGVVRGLPPQVRGAQASPVTGTVVVGLTPAGAGSTRGGLVSWWYWWAYPRRCGEHPKDGRRWSHGGGLPPQVRGARVGEDWAAVGGGLTPAGAGSTTGSCPKLTPWRAYPRRCGEHQPLPEPIPARGGLPPQVRGAQPVRVTHQPVVGLTPAGAGSTGRSGLKRSTKWAYPRRCGEHLRNVWTIATKPGLPPQVRGAPHRERRPRYRSGLTPAGAGSTKGRISLRSLRRAYPRRCGEHPLDQLARTCGGLPPQVRGAPGQRSTQQHLSRLTPAGAGSTSDTSCKTRTR